MKYKTLIQRLLNLITTPHKTWGEIKDDTESPDVMSAFVYPLVGLCGVIVFLSELFNEGMERQALQGALISTCNYCISLIGGFFLVSYLINLLRQRWLKEKDDMPRCYSLIGHSMAVVFVADALFAFFPQFFIFKWLLLFYTLYIVWEGTDIILNIPEERHLSVSILTTLGVIFAPTLIRTLFNTLLGSFI